MTVLRFRIGAPKGRPELTMLIPGQGIPEGPLSPFLKETSTRSRKDGWMTPFINGGGLSEAEVDEDAAEVFVVFFYAEVELFDLGALEETEHAFFQLAAPLPRDDLDQRDAFFNSLADDAVEFILYGSTLVKNIMQIKF